MAKKKVDPTVVEEVAHRKARELAVTRLGFERPSIEMINALCSACVEMDGIEVDEDECEELLQEFADAKDDLAKIAQAVFNMSEPDIVLKLEIFSSAEFDDDDNVDVAATVEKLRAARVWAQRVYLDESPRATFAAMDRIEVE